MRPVQGVVGSAILSVKGTSKGWAAATGSKTKYFVYPLAACIRKIAFIARGRFWLLLICRVVLFMGSTGTCKDGTAIQWNYSRQFMVFVTPLQSPGFRRCCLYSWH